MPGAVAEHATLHHSKAGYKVFGLGGWVLPGEKYRMQRVDQGQDFETEFGHHVHAPGPGMVVAHGADKAFPYGFGNPYAIVRIDHGPFAIEDGLWYIGHVNADVPPVGHRFQFGDPLGKTDHGLYAGWGWVELGKAGAGGFASTNGAKYHHLFVPVERKWPR